MNTQIIKQYIQLTKPGIIFGNLIAAIGGFLLASRGHFNLLLFTVTMLGVSLVIASGCVANNYIDRGIDAKMERTKKRALVKGSVSGKNALIYSAILGIIGFGVLAAYTNALTVLVGLVGYFFYVVMYSIWKRKSDFGTIVGSISGAVPPVAGYTAVTGRFDMAAFLLFLVLVMWQMPHFYAIAMYRLKEYKAASIPILPITKGLASTKVHILLYIAAFIAAESLLTAFHYMGYAYLSIVLLAGIAWFVYAVRGFKTGDDAKWARQVFRFSLIVLLIFCFVISAPL